MSERGSILVVDDSAETCEALARMLLPAGYVVQSVADGALALAAVAAAPPDLILLDVRMPGLDGLEVCRRLQAAEASRSVPVIFLTAADGLAERVTGLGLGAVDCITKPVGSEELLARVRTHLALGRARRQAERLAAERERELQVAVAERRRVEDRLRESEDVFRAVFERNAAAIAIINTDTTIALVNDAYCRLSGYPRDEVIGLSWTRQIPAEDLGRLQEYNRLRLLDPAAAPESYEFSFFARNGETRSAFMSVALVPGLGKLIASFIDITERKRAERDLLRRQSELLALNEVSAAVAATLDLGEIQDILTRHLLRLSGADRASIMLVDPASGRLRMVACWSQHGRLPADLTLEAGAGAAGWVLETNEPLAISDVARDARYVPRPHAERPTVSYLGLPLLGRGRPLGVVQLTSSTPRAFPAEEIAFLRVVCGAAAVGLDNALLHQEVRRHAERLTGEVAVQRQFAEDVLKSIADGVCVVDAADRVTAWNPAAEIITGWTAAEVMGRSCSDFLRHTDPGGSPLCFTGRCVLARIRETGGPLPTVELVGHARDGASVAMSVSAAPIVDEQRTIVGAVTVFRDVRAERALRESVERASRAKSVFLTTMSHEIRTPMNAVLGFAQVMMRDPELTAAQRVHLTTMTRAGEHLLGLINDILEMSKIEAGHTQLNPGTFDLHALLGDLETMFRVPVDEKQLQLVVERRGEVPRYVVADEGKLRQVLVNLLGNAVKFTARGRIAVRVGAEPRAGRTLRLNVAIEDTGPGMTPDEIQRLFQPFEQTGSGRATGGGTGLGLALSRGFVRLMGGDITVESRAGEGTVVRCGVELEAVDPATIAPTASPRRVLGLKPGQRGCRILIVDDKEDNRAVLDGLLRPLGFELRQARNGVEAVAEFAAWSPRIVLLDLRMPVMDGYEAMRQIRAMERGREVTIIAVTASAFSKTRAEVLAAGADDYIAKPLREAELLEKLHEHLHVEFLYEEPRPARDAPVASAGAPAAPDAAPSRLPAELVDELRAAVTTADPDRVLELIVQLETIDPQVARELRAYAERYEYELLLRRLAAQPLGP